MNTLSNPISFEADVARKIIQTDPTLSFRDLVKDISKTIRTALKDFPEAAKELTVDTLADMFNRRHFSTNLMAFLKEKSHQLESVN
jgi:hypothetical protein